MRQSRGPSILGRQRGLGETVWSLSVVKISSMVGMQRCARTVERAPSRKSYADQLRVWFFERVLGWV